MNTTTKKEEIKKIKEKLVEVLIEHTEEKCTEEKKTLVSLCSLVERYSAISASLDKELKNTCRIEETETLKLWKHFIWTLQHLCTKNSDKTSKSHVLLVEKAFSLISEAKESIFYLEEICTFRDMIQNRIIDGNVDSGVDGSVDRILLRTLDRTIEIIQNKYKTIKKELKRE